MPHDSDRQAIRQAKGELAHGTTGSVGKRDPALGQRGVSERFFAARQWYFADIYGEVGRQPEESQYAVALTSEEVLRLVVMPDAQGRYHFDEMGYENLPEYLGYPVGSPSWTACPR